MNLQLLNPLRWKRSLLVTILASFAILWFLFFDTYSLYTRYDLNQRKTNLEHRIEHLRQEADLLESQLEELRDNPDLLERIAREEYGMRRPGERVYTIEE